MNDVIGGGIGVVMWFIAVVAFIVILWVNRGNDEA